MKFTINKSDIVDAMGKIQGIAGRRSSLAITECVRIQATESEIHVTATDLETCYEGTFQAIVESPGTIAISARKFYEIVREFPSADILLQETDSRWINISNKKVHYNLMGMNADDFPQTPIFDTVDLFEVRVAEFKKMIDKSIVISGIGEDKKPHINGVLFEQPPDTMPEMIRMVSTDGSRLSKSDLALADNEKWSLGSNVLIPKKGLHEVSKFLASGASVRIGTKESYFIVKSPAETLAIRLLEGDFPNYQDLVLREEGYPIEVEKNLLGNMLRRMSILCTDVYRAAIFTFDTGLLTINATNPDIGESKEDMAIGYDGPKLEAGFNPKFFIEALNNIEKDKVVLNILNDEKPCLVMGAGDKTYLCAIMPMRV